MGDDKFDRENPDRSWIDLNEPNEVRYWTTYLKVTSDELRGAVKEVGTRSAKVKDFLERSP